MWIADSCSLPGCWILKCQNLSLLRLRFDAAACDFDAKNQSGTNWTCLYLSDLVYPRMGLDKALVIPMERETEAVWILFLFNRLANGPRCTMDLRQSKRSNKRRGFDGLVEALTTWYWPG